MIRVLYMSDLHLEMERWRLAVPGWPAFLARHRDIAAHPARGPLLGGITDIDLVVLAGDIHNGLRGIVYAEQVARFFGAPAVYAAGNHEFYGHDMGRLLPAFLNTAAHRNGHVQFLENALARFTIRGQRLNVLGCTLWTDYALNGHVAISMDVAGRAMNDHAMIKLGYDRFAPGHALSAHQGSRLWLHKTLAALRKADPEALNLIVTHHAPSPSFLGERTGEIAPAYASDMLVEFGHLRPSAWIHGHTHYRHSTIEEGIRLVSAPRGYVAYDGPEILAYRPGILEI